MAPRSISAHYTIGNFGLKNKDREADPRIISDPDSPGIRSPARSIHSELQ
jgi:hypothetical protein